MPWVLRVASRAVAIPAGIALGIYLLPTLISYQAPHETEYQAVVRSQHYKGNFRRDLKGSGFLHWAEGEVLVSRSHVAFKGKMAPGKDYMLYLVPAFVEDEAGFLAFREQSALIGYTSSFAGFVVSVPKRVNIEHFTTVVIWSERTANFISAAKYR